MTQTYIIAGPCAAESEQQVLTTAEGISRCRDMHPDHLYIYRAGVWKPRTSPDTFQGVGVEGLKWLQAVRQTYHLAVATEVTTSEQAWQAIAADIDYVWIGARTAANPIAVQTIADGIKKRLLQNAGCSLKGVLIKNPVNEDAALWIGNIARLESVGLPVMAVHRGCDHRPCWQMAYQLLQQRPDIPLIMDPSHLTGQAKAIEQMCKKTAPMAYQGWMIETHCAPGQAQSDASQQITPDELERVLTSVERVSSECRASVDLQWLRCMIDEVDDDLWSALAKRMDICRQIGKWKKEHGMAVVQAARYQEILQQRQKWGEEIGIEADAVTQIMEAIHKESIRIQS